ncbi:MAG: hypothetical protein JKP98_23635 [Rhodobacteraceae bacterium]|jgi:hypothetical protein|nr:hypothetical protein [Paracoccaceae bacterium]MBL4558962.1 hypothetical protein [Paracoccaceae bacterium]
MLRTGSGLEAAVADPQPNADGAFEIFFGPDDPRQGRVHQASFAGHGDRADVNNAAFQPLVIAQLGNGWYARSTAIWTYDFETDNYNIPLGLGLGKVIKTDTAIVNLFVEPQYSVVSSGDGLPEWGVFAGVNLQFPK